MARFDLSDGEWAAISGLLPKQGRGPQRKDDRKILNAFSTSCALASPGEIYLKPDVKIHVQPQTQTGNEGERTSAGRWLIQERFAPHSGVF